MITPYEVTVNCGKTKEMSFGSTIRQKYTLLILRSNFKVHIPKSFSTKYTFSNCSLLTFSQPETTQCSRKSVILKFLTKYRFLTFWVFLFILFFVKRSTFNFLPKSNFMPLDSIFVIFGRKSEL